MLGDKDNFAADREPGEQIEREYPGAADLAIATGALLGRTVRHPAGEGYGTRVFTGRPAQVLRNHHSLRQYRFC
ncbi:SAM-dependent methyltransferase [Streptomyces sp. NPDC015032]|uniref:SAM-dependent methyltransferase n=1 Tax=Streptomyces sp. NPDC015032 TaxID=3364937 RepID=UPI0036F789E9